MSCGHNLWIVTELWQWLVNKLETNDVRRSVSLPWNMKYDDEIETDNQVVCTWAWVGPCSYSQDSRQEWSLIKWDALSLVLRICLCADVSLIMWSMPILDPRVSQLFHATCHIYYSYITHTHHTHTHTNTPHTHINTNVYIYDICLLYNSYH